MKDERAPYTVIKKGDWPPMPPFYDDFATAVSVALMRIDATGDTFYVRDRLGTAYYETDVWRRNTTK